MKQVTLEYNVKEAMDKTKALKDMLTSVMYNRIYRKNNNFVILTFASTIDFLFSKAHLTEAIYFLDLFPWMLCFQFRWFPLRNSSTLSWDFMDQSRASLKRGLSMNGNEPHNSSSCAIKIKTAIKTKANNPQIPKYPKYCLNESDTQFIIGFT